MHIYHLIMEALVRCLRPCWPATTPRWLGSPPGGAGHFGDCSVEGPSPGPKSLGPQQISIYTNIYIYIHITRIYIYIYTHIYIYIHIHIWLLFLKIGGPCFGCPSNKSCTDTSSILEPLILGNSHLSVCMYVCNHMTVCMHIHILVLRPKTRGIPEAMSQRILLVFWDGRLELEPLFGSWKGAS